MWKTMTEKKGKKEKIFGNPLKPLESLENTRSWKNAAVFVYLLRAVQYCRTTQNT